MSLGDEYIILPSLTIVAISFYERNRWMSEDVWEVLNQGDRDCFKVSSF